MSTSSRIRELALTKLAGHNIDVVGFIDELLGLAQEIGAVRCSLAAENSLRFDLANLDSCEVELDACRGKLRMLCARLHVLCDAARDPRISPYGGEGIIHKASPSQPGNGNSNSAVPKQQWNARFKNTPAEQEFTVTPIKDSLASAASSPTGSMR